MKLLQNVRTIMTKFHHNATYGKYGKNSVLVSKSNGLYPHTTGIRACKYSTGMSTYMNQLVEQGG